MEHAVRHYNYREEAQERISRPRSKKLINEALKKHRNE